MPYEAHGLCDKIFHLNLVNFLSMIWKWLFGKRQTIYILDFLNHIFFVVTAQFCICNTKININFFGLDLKYTLNISHVWKVLARDYSWLDLGGGPGWRWGLPALSSHSASCPPQHEQLSSTISLSHDISALKRGDNELRWAKFNLSSFKFWMLSIVSQQMSKIAKISITGKQIGASVF